MAKILDLGSGTKSATQAWRALGHEVITVDWVEEADINGDWCDPETWERISELGPFSFVWFAPDCGIFSMAGGLPFDEKKNPTTVRAEREINGIKYALKKILELNPPWGFIMENPRAMMRKMDFVKNLHRVTVSLCQYGDRRMKPTDLFGRIPYSFRPKMCFAGASCHDAAPRGSKTGTQGMTKKEAGKMPYGLSKAIAEAVLESKGQTFPSLNDW